MKVELTSFVPIYVSNIIGLFLSYTCYAFIDVSVAFYCMEPLKIPFLLLSMRTLYTKLYLFYFKEDNCGKAGRAKLPQLLHLHEVTNAPGLESMYRLVTFT